MLPSGSIYHLVSSTHHLLPKRSSPHHLLPKRSPPHHLLLKRSPPHHLLPKRSPPHHLLPKGSPPPQVGMLLRRVHRYWVIFLLVHRHGVLFVGLWGGLCSKYYLILVQLTHYCRAVLSTFAVRETASLGIMGAPRMPRRQQMLNAPFGINGLTLTWNNILHFLYLICDLFSWNVEAYTWFIYV